jgi:DNA processing protein
LVGYCGSAEKVFTMPKGKLCKIPGIGSITASKILSSAPFQQAEKEIKKAERENASLLFFIDKNYPSRLRVLDDSPSLLYVKGNIDFENPKVVAIVGTRKATNYGKERVEELVNGLVAHKALVVSGLAYGIDIHAHRQALAHALPTVGVMGSGLDVMYPASHKDTARKMLEHGGWVTENRFGTKPDAHNFPARNRIIAGLCDALVVVEAAEKGGALITAEIANSYNKDVFAFPGNVGQSTSEGCNHLIKTNKAHLLTSVKDLEYIMQWDVTKNSSEKTSRHLQHTLQNLEPEERAVVKILEENEKPQQIDELSWKANLPVSQLASILLGLEFKSLVQSLPGKQYKLTSK